MGGPLLQVFGCVEQPLDLSYNDLCEFDAAGQIHDVSRFHSGRPGNAVRLAAILDRACPLAEAGFLTLHASRDGFSASVPLDAVREHGIVVYQLDDAPLPTERGGPVRFMIPDPAACRTDELDDCVNVKYVDRIELSVERGRDTRPHDEDEHAALHANE